MRITPACAGKSYRKFGVAFVIQDHPRVCGEKENLIIYYHNLKGSPPRVRGKD